MGMDAHTRSLFTKAELDLLDKTAPKTLSGMSHAELVKLSALLRKNSDKYRDLYRRQGAQTVESTHARSATATSNASTAEKATEFHDALMRVNDEIDRHDQDDAKSLRDQRLAQARAGRSTGPGSTTSGGGKAGAGRSEKTNRGPSGKAGATRSANSRAQAKRDGK
jgi:hypothetical protein